MSVLSWESIYPEQKLSKTPKSYTRESKPVNLSYSVLSFNSAVANVGFAHIT